MRSPFPGSSSKSVPTSQNAFEEPLLPLEKQGVGIRKFAEGDPMIQRTTPQQRGCLEHLGTVFFPFFFRFFFPPASSTWIHVRSARCFHELRDVCDVTGTTSWDDQLGRRQGDVQRQSSVQQSFHACSESQLRSFDTGILRMEMHLMLEL